MYFALYLKANGKMVRFALISAFKNKGKSKQMEKWLQRANYFE
jgi:hypothetical protein